MDTNKILAELRRPTERSQKRAAFGATTSKQRREIAESTARARFAKRKKSRQPQD